MFKLSGLNRKKFSWNVVFLRKLFYCFQLNLCATSVLLSKTIWLMSSMMRVSWCSWWTTETATYRKKCLFCSKILDSLTAWMAGVESALFTNALDTSGVREVLNAKFSLSTMFKFCTFLSESASIAFSILPKTTFVQNEMFQQVSKPI